MVWARFDDKYPVNRKVRKLTDAAYRLDSSAICWSSGEGTDGHIPTDDIGIVSEVRKPATAAAELVRHGRWHLPGHNCESEHCYPIDDGWLIHDFLDYNPAAAKVEQIRRARANAGRNGGKTSSKRRASLKAVGEANA